MGIEISSLNEAPELRQTREHLFAATEVLSNIVLLQQRPDIWNVRRMLESEVFSDVEIKYLRHYRTSLKDRGVLFDEKLGIEFERLQGDALAALHCEDPSAIPMLLVSGLYSKDDIQEELGEIEQLPNAQPWINLRITADIVKSKGGIVVFPSKDFISGIPVLAHCDPKRKEVVFQASQTNIQGTNRRISGYSDSFEVVQAMFANPHRR